MGLLSMKIFIYLEFLFLKAAPISKVFIQVFLIIIHIIFYCLPLQYSFLEMILSNTSLSVESHFFGKYISLFVNLQSFLNFKIFHYNIDILTLFLIINLYFLHLFILSKFGLFASYFYRNFAISCRTICCV